MKVLKKRRGPYTISPYIWKLVGQFTKVTIQLGVTALKNTSDRRQFTIMIHGGIGINEIDNNSCETRTSNKPSSHKSSGVITEPIAASLVNVEWFLILLRLFAFVHSPFTLLLPQRMVNFICLNIH